MAKNPAFRILELGVLTAGMVAAGTAMLVAHSVTSSALSIVLHLL